jgi:AcrR family transcriptional regulator
MPTQAERAGATRTKLLAVARKLFASRGYAATSLDDLVRRAGMTKGAFYHHFPTKEAIFRAVFEETEAQLVAAAHARSHGRDAVERFRNGCHAFLEACLDPAVQRIVMTDGPAVLGWETWREIDWRYWLAGIEAGLASAMADGLVRTRPTKPLAHVIFGALCESANVIARASDPRRALAEVRRELDAVLAGLLVGPRSRRRRRTTLQT